MIVAYVCVLQLEQVHAWYERFVIFSISRLG